MSAAFSLYFYPCGLSGLAAVEQLHEACQGYDNWLRLAFALSDGLGEAGRQIFDRLSQMNADYDTRECNRLYDNCMKGNKGGIRLSGNLVGISIYLCKSLQKVLFINDAP